MYISELSIQNFRTFEKVDTLKLLHGGNEFIGQEDNEKRLQPKYPNLNIILGNNGAGKTAFLKCIALAGMGPAIGDSGIFPYRLVRIPPGVEANDELNPCRITAKFLTHEQDDAPYSALESDISIEKIGDLERMKWIHHDDKSWHPIFSSNSDAFFMVAYGTMRRVEKPRNLDFSSRNSNSSVRAQRIRSLFEETYSLVPLNYWLPVLQSGNPGRYSQVITLLEKVTGGGGYSFTGEMENQEYVFEKDGLRVPFPALSDGYRAFLGWMGDLLYHIVETCPAGKKLVDNHGIVIIDEIDLHLHPEWQKKILPLLSSTFPNIQFIVTTHSPLVVGSIEWMNLIVLEPGPNSTSIPVRREQAVYGLDADQILITGLFGLSSTRASEVEQSLKELTIQARKGDKEAAKELIRVMSGQRKTNFS